MLTRQNGGGTVLTGCLC